MRYVLLLMFVVVFVSNGRADRELDCLGQEEQTAVALYAQLQQQAYAALDRRDEAYERLASSEQIRLIQAGEQVSARLAVLKLTLFASCLLLCEPDLSDAFQRCDQYLQANGVNLNSSRAVVGPWVTWDSEQQRFVDDFADAANKLSRPVYRKPFEVPRLA